LPTCSSVQICDAWVFVFDSGKINNTGKQQLVPQRHETQGRPDLCPRGIGTARLLALPCRQAGMAGFQLAGRLLRGGDPRQQHPPKVDQGHLLTRSVTKAGKVAPSASAKSKSGGLEGHYVHHISHLYATQVHTNCRRPFS